MNPYYCWWKKSCTTWDVKNLVNNGIFTRYLPANKCPLQKLFGGDDQEWCDFYVERTWGKSNREMPYSARNRPVCFFCLDAFCQIKIDFICKSQNGDVRSWHDFKAAWRYMIVWGTFAGCVEFSTCIEKRLGDFFSVFFRLWQAPTDLGGGSFNIFCVHPAPWGNDEIWLWNIVQMGWFNHQLVMNPATHQILLVFPFPSPRLSFRGTVWRCWTWNQGAEANRKIQWMEGAFRNLAAELNHHGPGMDIFWNPCIQTLPGKTERMSNVSWKSMVGRWIPCWNSPFLDFLGDILVFGGVNSGNHQPRRRLVRRISEPSTVVQQGFDWNSGPAYLCHMLAWSIHCIMSISWIQVTRIGLHGFWVFLAVESDGISISKNTWALDWCFRLVLPP